MIEDALSYPLEGDEAVKNLAIGGLMTALSFLFVPGLIVGGYVVAAIRTTVMGYDQPPQFTDWETLLKDGAKAFGISLIYGLVPLFFMFLLTMVTGAVFGNSDAGGLILLLVYGVGFIVYFAFLFVVPAALTNFAAEDEFTAAFEFDDIVDFLTSGPYIKAFLFAFVINIIVNVVSTVLWFTLIGALLIPWVTFFMYLAIGRLYGQAYREVQPD